MNTTSNLIFGDCLEEMQKFKADSIDLTVTSPPYDNLRTYEDNIDQWTFEKFQLIAKQLFRITKDGGVVVWVVGDATIDGSETCTSFQQAIFFRYCGFNLHDTMIYEKKNPVPQTSNRYQSCFEYMFVFSKGKLKTFNPIEEKCDNFGLSVGHRTFRTKEGELINNSKINTVREYKLRKNIWQYKVGGLSNYSEHPAKFPAKLARDHIISWSNEGDTVFDPFSGSGTTGEQCAYLDRNFIGTEICKKYYDIAKGRIEKAINDRSCMFFNVNNF